MLSLVALTFPIDSQFFSALRDQETTLPLPFPSALLSTLFQVVVIVVACLPYANEVQLVIVNIVGKSPTHYTTIFKHVAVANVGRLLTD